MVRIASIFLALTLTLSAGPAAAQFGLIGDPYPLIADTTGYLRPMFASSTAFRWTAPDTDGSFIVASSYTEGFNVLGGDFVTARGLWFARTKNRQVIDFVKHPGVATTELLTSPADGQSVPPFVESAGGPVIEFADGGDILVVYSKTTRSQPSGTPASSERLLLKLGTDLQPLGDPVAIERPSSGATGPARIRPLAGGDFMVLDTGRNVFRYDSDGATVSSFTAYDGDPPHFSTSDSIQFTAGNRVAWLETEFPGEDFEKGHGFIYELDGFSVADDFAVNEAPLLFGDFFRGHVVPLSGGDVLYTWTNLTQDYFARRFNDDGTPAQGTQVTDAETVDAVLLPDSSDGHWACDENGFRRFDNSLSQIASAPPPVGTGGACAGMLPNGSDHFIVYAGGVSMQLYAEPLCGDGVIQGAEACDGGSTCSPTCTIVAAGICGDNALNPGEECDDGNMVSFDGCSDVCVIEADATGEFVVTTGSVATGADPIVTTVVSQNAGPIRITESGPSAVPTFIEAVGQQIRISAPAASGPSTPLLIRFTLDRSIIPPGKTHATIAVYKNGGTPIPACAAPGVAAPDPCVSGRVAIAGGDAEITVLTTSASDWLVGSSCGDGSVDAGEGCDDGNNADSDGCTAECFVEGEQSKDQRKCLASVNKHAAKAFATRIKAGSFCMKSVAKGDITPAEAAACFDEDPKGKMSGAVSGAYVLNADRCLTEAPSWGYGGPTPLAVYPYLEASALFTDLFGELDPGLVPAASKCQAALTKVVGKLAKTAVKEFSKCEASAMKSSSKGPATIVSGDAVVGCLFDDPKSKLAKAAAKIERARTKTCEGEDLSVVAAGKCGAETDVDFDACLESLARCNVCLMIDAISDLRADCDLQDDGESNASCS